MSVPPKSPKPPRRPERRPLAGREPAPAPSRWHSRGKLGPLARLCAGVGRRLARTRPGQRHRQRLAAGVEWTKTEIALGRGHGDLDGLSIALVSDVHAGHFMDEDDLVRLAEGLAEAEPDLVCLVGDLVDTAAEEMLLWRRALEPLRPPLGIYAVPGNHDYVAERELKLFRDVLSEAGARVLVNEGERVRVGQGALFVAGVDDHSLGRPDLPLAMYGAREEEPVLLLSHHPDLFHEAVSLGVDLTLAGHTHGGQIVLGGRTPCTHTALGYWRGHFERAGAQLYVGRGAGVTLVPLRVGAPAELPILVLRR